MVRSVVIIGGGVAGLGAAVALADQGRVVTVLERDPMPECGSGDEAFLSWRRPGVTQFRQAHGFSARSRNLLLERAPQVVEALVADGVEEMNFFKLLAPPELWTEADDAYTNLWARRPGFELALRRYAEGRVDLHAPAAAAGVVIEDGDPPRVTGVRVAGGGTIEADLVIDAGGRRSPVPRWLAEAGVHLELDDQDCDIVYFTRYYRRNPNGPSPLLLIGGAAVTDRFGFNTFTGDHDTYALLMVCRPDDRRLLSLRHDEVFEAVAARLPLMAPWIEPEAGTPIHGVEMMSGNRNRRWRYLSEGRPAVMGLLPVGDALCSTNPFYGWGASMALTYAFAAADAICDDGADLRDVLVSYEDRIGAESDGVYRESAADDRLRIYRWRAQEIPDHDREEMERRELIACIGAGALKDPVLGRAFLRRTGLLDPPGSALDDPEVVEHARNTQRILAGKAARRIAPDGDELEEIVRAAAHPVAARRP